VKSSLVNLVVEPFDADPDVQLKLQVGDKTVDGPVPFEFRQAELKVRPMYDDQACDTLPLKSSNRYFIPLTAGASDVEPADVAGHFNLVLDPPMALSGGLEDKPVRAQIMDDSGVLQSVDLKVGGKDVPEVRLGDLSKVNGVSFSAARGGNSWPAFVADHREVKVLFAIKDVPTAPGDASLLSIQFEREPTKGVGSIVLYSGITALVALVAVVGLQAVSKSKKKRQQARRPVTTSGDGFDAFNDEPGGSPPPSRSSHPTADGDGATGHAGPSPGTATGAGSPGADGGATPEDTGAFNDTFSNFG
jgi:hypothetical protein